MTRFLYSFILSIFALLICSNTHAQVWKRQAKSGNAGLQDVVFISKSTGFVLSAGKVLKTTDTGKTWNQILSSYNRFSRIQFAEDAKTGYLVGYDDLILKTTDGGNNWGLKRTGNSDDDLSTLFALDKDTLFVAGPDNIDNNDSANYLEYSYNGGNSWNRRNLNSTKTITSIAMLNKNSGIISAHAAGLYETSNGFSTYNTNTSTGLNIMDSKIIQDSIIVLVGDSGKISRSIDYGKNYKGITSPTSENLKGLHFANDTFGMACGDMGTILFTNNAGQSWTAMTTNTKLDFTRVYAINPYLAWAVAYSTTGDSIDIFKYEDKSCISRYVKVPGDTVICDKYDYETPFITLGPNKPTWTINDNQTQLIHKGDSIASIVGTHEGYYIIAYTLQSCEETLLDTSRIFLWRNPTISVYDSLYCGSVNDNITFSCFACAYLWNDTIDSYKFVVTQPGTYWVKVTNRCKTISDTFTLSYLPYLNLDLGNDTILCNQETLKIQNTLSPGKYLWNDLDTNASKTISKAGTYSLNFTNKCNNLADTISIAYKRTPVIDLGPDSLYCNSITHPVKLDSVKNNSQLIWNDANTDYNRVMTQAGKYEVSLSNECGLAKDSIKLEVTTAPAINIGKDTIYCQNFKHTISLKPKTAFYTIEWWDKDTSIQREFTLPGTYAVKVYNQCGLSLDSIIILQKSIPNVDLGKDTSIKKPFSLTLDAKNPGSNYLWSTGLASQTISVNDFGIYWVRASNYCGIDSDTILIKDKAGVTRVKNIILKIYPNPVTDGKLIIENNYGDIGLKLFDAFGKKVLVKEVTLTRETIDISQMTNGVYFLKIIRGNELMETVRVLKL